MFLGDDSAVADIDGMTQKLVSQISARAAVLEIPCGIGRHAREWARRGYAVTAVDRTQRYIDEGRARAAANHVNVEWVVSDMRAFRRAGAFDVVSCLSSSFGYFEDERDDLGFLERCKENLRAGGRLVLELKGKEVVQRQAHRKHWWQVGDVLVLQEQTTIDEGRRIALRWLVVCPDGTRGDYTMRLRLYDAAAIESVVRSAGFANVELFGTLAGGSYDDHAAALVVVAS
jgi:SAM-dependent methyltransferase